MTKDVISHTYESNQLCVMNTFFQSSNYVTYKSFNDESTECTLDVFAASKSLVRYITNCRVVNDGAISDHSAVQMKLTRISMDVNTTITNKKSHGTLDKMLLTRDKNAHYNKIVTDKLEENKELKDSYDDFMKMIVEAARTKPQHHHLLERFLGLNLIVTL